MIFFRSCLFLLPLLYSSSLGCIDMETLHEEILFSELPSIGKKTGFDKQIQFRSLKLPYLLVFSSNPAKAGKCYLYKKGKRSWLKHTELTIPKNSLPPEVVTNADGESDFVYVATDLGDEKIMIYVLQVSGKGAEWKPDTKGLLIDGVWRQ